MFKDYLEEKERARCLAKTLIGKEISYQYSGHPMSGEVLRVHEFTDQLWVKSRTGKAYYIFWGCIK